MKVLQVTTSVGTMRDAGDNARRLSILDAALGIAKGSRCRVVHLPAGFLAVAAGNDVKERVEKLLLEQVVPRSTARRIAIVGGVDLAHGGSKNGRLPYYGFIVNEAGLLHGPWKQQSNVSRYNDEEGNVPASQDNAVTFDDRRAKVYGRSVTLLVCGEMHSEFNRCALGAMKPRPKIVFVSGHNGLTRVTRSIESVASGANAPVSHVQHLSSAHSGTFHIVAGDGEHSNLVGDRGEKIMEGWWRYAVRDLG